MTASADRRASHSFSRRLLLFALVSSLLLPLGLLALPGQPRRSLLRESYLSLIEQRQELDSWGPMLLAFDYLQRPGKMRFEYRPPVTMEVVADGTSVAIRDRKLATQDLYSIGQTPLKFLLKEQMNLERDTIVTGVSTKGDILSLKLEDRSTLGGTSKITLNFDLAANTLRQWVVIDPQGYETSVSLYNLDTQRRPDQKNFVIDYQRVL